MKVCIDPGHGGNDPGSSKFGLKEKVANLDIALKLRELLIMEGLEVRMTRQTDRTVSLKDRAEFINNSNCDISLSIHNNAALAEDANGSEIIYPADSREGEILSQYILDELGSLGLKKRRVYSKLNSLGDDYYYIIRNARKLSIIVECAFVTNVQNNQLLQSDSFRLEIAEAIKRGLLKFRDQFFGKPKTHWAKEHFDRLQDAGLVNNYHDLDKYVTWGEFATVISRLLNRFEGTEDN